MLILIYLKKMKKRNQFRIQVPRDRILTEIQKKITFCKVEFVSQGTEFSPTNKTMLLRHILGTMCCLGN